MAGSGITRLFINGEWRITPSALIRPASDCPPNKRKEAFNGCSRWRRETDWAGNPFGPLHVGRVPGRMRALFSMPVADRHPSQKQGRKSNLLRETGIYTMAENKDSDLVKHFMMHLVTGGILFIAAAAISAALELSADSLDEFPKLWLLAIVFHVVGYIILALDIGCLVFFLVIRAYRFVRETWIRKMRDKSTPTGRNPPKSSTGEYRIKKLESDGSKRERSSYSISKIVKDDIALYLSPLTAVAGEFRKQLKKR
jgi:hypothetical protein